jgi:hypothetical protein
MTMQNPAKRLIQCSLLVSCTLTAVSCDRLGRDYLTEPNENWPGVVHLGELPVLTDAEFQNPADRIENITYARIGAAEPGTFGGATATFTSTGGSVCIIVDPEAVFWNQSVAAQGAKQAYSYPDNYRDDGDVDIEVGLTAYYDGSPGYEMGDFAAIYEDSLGNEVKLEFNECFMPGYGSTTDAHAGRAAIEYCTIDTSIHPGKSYTVVLNAYSVPLDDALMDYAVAIIDGACSDIGQNAGGLDECLLPQESRTPGKDASSLLEPDADFSMLESAYCNGELLEFCTANPDLCGDLD